MSLLMDALRKAEEEKRKAAERQEQGVRATSADSEPAVLKEALLSEELKLEPLVEQTQAVATPESTQASSSETSDLDVIMAPPASEREETADVTDTWPSQREVHSSVEDYLDGSQSLSLEQEKLQPTQAEAKLEQIMGQMDLESTLPSKRELESALHDYFESSRSVAKKPLPAEIAVSTEVPLQAQDEGATEAALSGDGTVPTHERIKSITPPPLRVNADPAATHVTAHTIFSSTQATYASRVKRYSLLSSLVIFALVGTAVLYYVLLPPIQVTPAPSVAIEAPPAVPDPARETQPPAPPSQVAAPAATQPSAAAFAQTEAVSPTVEPSISQPQSITALPAAEDQPFSEATREAGSERPIETVVIPEPASEQSIPVDPYSQPIAVLPSAIKISRGKTTRDRNADLAQAYRAYRAGDYVAARRAYEAVLRVQPEQRDALLGFAAIESRVGRIERAHRIYAQVLRRNPRDPVASAALFNLHNLAGGDVAESQLKLLLDQHHDSPSLHFSLGNFYARRSRWPEAQQAYFSAFSADKDNPEYAYNLAVSLDQLGEANVATQYYQKALILSNERAPSFNVGEVRSRIRALSGRDSFP
ncbi:MAG: tetratricopeptide repeat protein [Gammaproteobacteria bacterium]